MGFDTLGRKEKPPRLLLGSSANLFQASSISAAPVKAEIVFAKWK